MLWEGENDGVELNLLVGILFMVAGSGASSGNQFQCPVLTGDVVMLFLVCYALPCMRRCCMQKSYTRHWTGEAERPYMQVK